MPYLMAMLLAVSPTFGPSTDSSFHVKGALELSALSFPSGVSGGEQDLFAQVNPVLGMSVGPSFALTLAADLRLRLVDEPPAQKQGDFDHLLRKEDWDSASDYGQVLQSLEIDQPGDTFWMRAGEIDDYTLGNGHLIAHYANRTNPNYHPSGAALEFNLPAARVQLFASDLLAARLFATDVQLDFGQMFGSKALAGRYLLSISAAQDFGNGEIETPSLTAAQVEGQIQAYRDQTQKIDAYFGVGTRFGGDAPPIGLVLGVKAEGRFTKVRIRGKAEARKQGAGFRQGLIGPDYELQRFSDVGFTQTSLLNASLPDGFSAYLEGSADVLQEGTGAAWLTATASAEYFFWGRTDLYASVTFRTLNQKGAGTFRLTALGLGLDARYHVEGELRYRIIPGIYALAEGGTVFFPQPDHTLAHGVYAALGAGFDFAH